MTSLSLYVGGACNSTKRLRWTRNPSLLRSKANGSLQESQRRRPGDLPEERGSQPRRSPQDQQRHCAGDARQANGPEKHRYRHRSGAARRRNRGGMCETISRMYDIDG